MGLSNGVNIPEWLKTTGVAACPCCSIGRGKGFIEKNIAAIASFIKEVLEPEGFANKNGLLQQIDPRARLLGILLFMLTAALLKSALSIILLLSLVILMAAASRVNAMILLKRALPVLIFTLFLVLPAVFNFINPGAPVITISARDAFPLYISKQGLEGIAVFLLRVGAMVSLLSLFMLTTAYSDVFRALQTFPIPKIFVAALSMTFRYIMVLIKVAEDSHLARKVRTIKPSTLKQGRGWLASRIWFIIERSMETAEDVYLAMTARGFMGEIKTMTIFEMKGRDYGWIGFSLFILFLSMQL
ncbi:MAG: cobalt ECF transporter T component CbiQ [Deltaproteobacteria bacterium RIFCSPLOWO2_12_FULL_43_16]|nr:MAG: cobalt ECF transporter T component CbiQ [Deltaproteobacteria bacterium GWA2_43_19]OGQ11348.1 MAG: cobalt ECF transporter T component CbiQ [Deltaproteobacteria bacterium RIFCSPHIGHO2_02_FULL_43_33]OGQ58982.1 MAG: cobalt ECF transporter T component CbiQ [Deltaproteobacteria bacterium RIFCSPLOWO2_12_FULL_43_16]